MIYLFDDSSDSYVRKHIDVAEYSDVLCFHSQMSGKAIARITDELSRASCIMVHSSLRDHNDPSRNRVYETLVSDVCDMGRILPLVIFSDGFDEPKFKGDRCIRQMKKSLFYENLVLFLDKFRETGIIDLRLIAFGSNTGKVAALNEGQNVLNKLSFCQPEDSVNVELVAGTSLKRLVEMSQPSLGVTYPDLITQLRMGGISVAEFRRKINSIVRSFAQYGSNIVQWNDADMDEAHDESYDIVKTPEHILSDHGFAHDFMMELFSDPRRNAVILDTRTDLAFSLKLAMHIRLSLEFIGMKALCPIILISELGTDSLTKSSKYAQLLLTEHVYVSTEAGLKACLKNVTPMKLESYQSEFLSRISIEPPSFSENDRHGLANQWGAGVLYRTVTGRRYDGTDCPELIAAQKELYFKYIMMSTCDDLQSLVIPSKKIDFSKDRLKVQSAGKKVLLIDDMADKGWTVGLKEFLPGAEIDVICRQVMDFSEYSAEEKGMIRDGDYDLYLLDLRLGGGREENIYDPYSFSGTKILRQIKKFNRGRQVIMFTASNKTWNSRALLSPEIGADGYYVKENPSFKFPETFSRKSIEAFAKEIRNCYGRSYLKEFWDFKETNFTFGGEAPALFEECGRQVDMAFDLTDWAVTADQFRHAFVSAEQVFEIMSKYVIEIEKTNDSQSMKMRSQDDMRQEQVRMIYQDPQGMMTYIQAVTEPFSRKTSENISMFDKLSAIYLQYLGAKDDGLLYILNQMIQIRNKIMHCETKKEQEKKESRSRVMNMDLFLKEYASKAPAFTEGRIGEFMLELVEKGLLRESRIKGRPVMVIDKGVAHDKIGIQLMLECLKAFFEKFR